MSYDVVVVGAGLAGLRAAQVLEDAGVESLIIERAEDVGGRLASREVDGYVVDEGFQLLNPAYPELAATAVLLTFDLRSFDPAVTLVREGGRTTLADPKGAPIQALRMLWGHELSRHDVVATARLFARCGLRSVRSILRRPDQSTREGLAAAGLSAHAIDDVFGPFLRGTLLDDDLDTSWRYAQLLLRSFFWGRPGTHADGIQALPRALADRLDATEIRCGEEVTEVGPTRVVTTAGVYEARRVIVATDATVASHLAGSADVDWRSQTTWWYSLPALEDAGSLRLDLERRFLTSALDLAAAAPERAPLGRSLVAAAANGVHVDAAVRADVARLYGTSVGEVELVARTAVERALPVLGRPLRLARSSRVGDLILAGDHLQTPSIQGALVSGRRAAQCALADLGVGPAA